MSRASKRFFPVGATLTETRHEFLERFRTAAVTVASLRSRRWKPGLQRFHHAAPDFVLNFENVFAHEVMILGIGDLLRPAIEKLGRNAPA